MIKFLLLLCSIYIASLQDLLFIEEDIILELPSFNKSDCPMPSFPGGNSSTEFIPYSVTGLVSNALTACVRGLCWSFSAGVWTSIANMTVPRGLAASSSSPEGWMVTGGFIIPSDYDYEYESSFEDTFTNSTEVFTDGSWTSRPDLDLPYTTIAHCQLQAAGTVFVLGGTKGGDTFGGAYSLEGNSWKSLAQMITPRGGHSCAFFKNKIYVMGGVADIVNGFAGTAFLNSTEVYDTVSDRWDQGPDLWTGYFSHAVVYGDALYVAGGAGSDGRISRLNSAGTDWDKIASTAHTGFRLFFPAQIIKSEICLPDLTTQTVKPTSPPAKGCKCGPVRSGRKNKVKGRISGGQPAGNKYPWMTLLFFSEADRQYGCGGVIVNSRWILTALHCVVKNSSVPLSNLTEQVFDFKKNNGKVFVGARRLNKRNQLKVTKRTREFQIEEIKLHPAGVDLAMVKVSTDIDIKTYRPICLPDKADELNLGKKATIAGFGKKATATSQILMELEDLDLKNVTECWSGAKLPANWFCFGGNDAQYACTGDSGGPVMVKEKVTNNNGNTDVRWTLAGIISGGTNNEKRCGGQGLAINVYRNLNWITFTALEGEFCTLI